MVVELVWRPRALSRGVGACRARRPRAGSAAAVRAVSAEAAVGAQEVGAARGAEPSSRVVRAGGPREAPQTVGLDRAARAYGRRATLRADRPGLAVRAGRAALGRAQAAVPPAGRVLAYAGAPALGAVVRLARVRAQPPDPPRAAGRGRRGARAGPRALAPRAVHPGPAVRAGHAGLDRARVAVSPAGGVLAHPGAPAVDAVVRLARVRAQPPGRLRPGAGLCWHGAGRRGRRRPRPAR